MDYCEQLRNAPTPYARNALLFRWLCDEDARPALYAQARREQPVIEVLSCAKRAGTDGATRSQSVYLLTRRADIETALSRASNAPYRPIGSGSFVLGLDNGEGHEEQRHFLIEALRPQQGDVNPVGSMHRLAALACQQAMVLPCKGESFDLVSDVAEQATLRFVAAYFGFESRDHVLLQEAMRRTYYGMITQMFARHFATEPRRIDEGRAAMASLAQRVGELLANVDLTRRADPAIHEPLIARLARSPNGSSQTDLAVAVVGLLAGLVGNIIAGTCSTVDRYFRSGSAVRGSVQQRAVPLDPHDASYLMKAQMAAESLMPFVREALRLQPPAAFVPRLTTTEVTIELGNGDRMQIPRGSEVIVALGAATRDLPASARPDDVDEQRAGDAFTFVFGDPSDALTSHRCIGDHIALPMIAHLARSVLSLPGLAQAGPLRKRWGYICESYPLQFTRDAQLVQRPLSVIMRVKSPSAVHAQALKDTIRHAAPLVEHVLMDSNLVHFARFLFLDDDRQLALFTTYEGSREDYLEHFARVAGPLFDLIFTHIEDAPPLPVKDHPQEFVRHIMRYDRPPAEGYFFSAYPRRSLQQIKS